MMEVLKREMGTFILPSKQPRPHSVRSPYLLLSDRYGSHRQYYSSRTVKGGSAPDFVGETVGSGSAAATPNSVRLLERARGC